MKAIGTRLVPSPRFWLLLLAVIFSGSATRPQTRLGNYIVKLRDDPVITYVSRRETAPKGRMNLATGEAASYRAQLLAKQASLKRRIENLPDAQVRMQVNTVFNGLGVTLRPEDVDAVRRYPEVEQVIASIRYKKLLDAALPLTTVPQAWSSPRIGGEDNAGAGVKIAIIDTGIDTTHPMLQDLSLVPPSGFPRFTAATLQCPSSDQRYTNSKVIVARNYVTLLESPDPNCDAEDRDGHGTLIAGIAAGRRAAAPLASVAGVAPKAFLGSYKVFGTPGTNDESSLKAILQAIEDAVNDGMDIINLSLGATINAPPSSDTLSLAVATAVDSGATVVAAAGNEGPGTGTITSPGISPAAITVGATTNSRLFANPLLVTAPVPVPPNLETIAALPGNGPRIWTPVGPAPLTDVAALDPSGNACSPFSSGSLRGQMALIRRGECTFAAKIRTAFEAGAIAAILFNNQVNQPPITMDVGDATQIPAVMIGNSDGVALQRFLTTTGPGVRGSLILEQRATTPNRIANFSSHGPSTDFGVKPDLVAPGSNIYGPTQRNDPSGEGYDPTGFDTASGTSFSAPIVAGAAALVKQSSPAFTPAQIKSALMNSAARVVSSSQGGFAGVLAQGNGLLDADAAVQTPATVSPTSISFGANPPDSFLSSTTGLSITNVSAASDTFSVSATSAPGSPGLTWTVSPSTFTVAAGNTFLIAVTARAPEPLRGTVEGFLAIRSQDSGRTLTVPYWGAFVQPTVNTGGVVNGAGFTAGPPSIAAGSLISIFGTQLVNESGQASTLPLPTSVGGTTVTIGGIAAPIVFASPNQINAQAPVELAGRSSAQMIVELNGVSSAPTTVLLSPAAPGIFTVDQNGRGRGAILRASNSSPVAPSNPARPGEILEVYATGLGPTSPAVETGQPAPSVPPATTQIRPSATLAGVPAQVRFSGLAPSFVGLYQINVEVPAGIPSGEQTLILTANGSASNPVTVFIGP